MGPHGNATPSVEGKSIIGTFGGLALEDHFATNSWNFKKPDLDTTWGNPNMRWWSDLFEQSAKYANKVSTLSTPRTADDSTKSLNERGTIPSELKPHTQ